jgi:hypothetical protein
MYTTWQSARDRTRSSHPAHSKHAIVRRRWHLARRAGRRVCRSRRSSHEKSSRAAAAGGHGGQAGGQPLLLVAAVVMAPSATASSTRYPHAKSQSGWMTRTGRRGLLPAEQEKPFCASRAAAGSPGGSWQRASLLDPREGAGSARAAAGHDAPGAAGGGWSLCPVGSAGRVLAVQNPHHHSRNREAMRITRWLRASSSAGAPAQQRSVGLTAADHRIYRTPSPHPADLTGNLLEGRSSGADRLLCKRHGQTPDLCVFRLLPSDAASDFHALELHSCLLKRLPVLERSCTALEFWQDRAGMGQRRCLSGSCSAASSHALPETDRV